MILDGKALAIEVLAHTKKRANVLSHRPMIIAYIARNITPATQSYLKIKMRSAIEAGCDFMEIADTKSLFKADAAIVQFPTTLNQKEIDLLLPLDKDADVLSTAAREKFIYANKDALLPPVVAAMAEIFRKYDIKLEGKQAVIIGEGFLVGKPSATWLRQQGSHVDVLTRTSIDFIDKLHAADIVVSGAGSPHFITPEMLSNNIIFIDAGTSESGSVLVGDANPSCAEKCTLFTPVPGGIGPIAVAELFANAVTLAERAINK